jgi:hypothetical protein
MIEEGEVEVKECETSVYVFERLERGMPIKIILPRNVCTKAHITIPEATVDMKAIYTEKAREPGYAPGPEHCGYVLRIHVQDTDEYAKEVDKGYLVGNVGVGRLPMPPDYMFPVGYNGRAPKYLALRV